MEPTTPPTDSTESEEVAQGLLLVDKPGGMTSHDVVQQVRRVYGQRSIGHLGTLDPFATGLLVLLLGRATRLATFLDTEPKVYEATIRFGTETDTDDSTGTVIRTDALPKPGSLEFGIAALTGRISQVPPAYSAKSVDGTRAYDAARRGEPLTLAAVEVTVHRWDVKVATVECVTATITCSGGTYIRALARDLGRLLQSAAHLETLRRTRVGPFDVNESATLADLAERPVRVRPLRVIADA